jgi:SAM-dependent methyltransferase
MQFAPAGSKVLDIGAGPGTLTVPLAQKGYRVTAVEPAAGMLVVLNENIRGLPAVERVVAKPWEAVIPAQDLWPPYDLTVCAFALGMHDLRAALTLMQQVTHGWAVLYWHVDDQPYEREAKALWPYFSADPFPPIPKSDVVLGVLNEMGVAAQVTITSGAQEKRFENYSAAEEDISRRYPVTTDAQRAAIRRYLDARLIQTEEACVLQAAHDTARIAWQAEAKTVP